MTRNYTASGQTPVVVKESIFKYPMIILTVALCAPIVRALWLAIDHIPGESWAAIGVVLVSLLFLITIGVAVAALYLWVRQPVQGKNCLKKPITGTRIHITGARTWALKGL